MGDNMNFFIIFKTVILYLVIFIVYRIIDKRKIIQLKVGDLAVLLFSLSIIIIGYNGSLLLSLVMFFLLVFLEFVINRYVIVKENNKYSVIVDRGRINFGVMLREDYNLDVFINELRRRKIKSIVDVDYAILDSNYNLIIFTKENNYPLPLIMDGKVVRDVLIQIDKDEEWLRKVISDEGYLLDDVFYGFYKDNEVFLIKKDYKVT